jgi:hypothetical protein
MPMKQKYDKQDIKNSRKKTISNLGNSILYKLCKDHFKHVKDEHIVTKVLFIGRIYAAAVERRKSKGKEINDNFYKIKVVKAFKSTDLDNRLNRLKKIRNLNIDSIMEILSVHSSLMATLKKITGMDKRSFCSKYLHFHLPNLFFIYDSRALSTVSSLTNQVSNDLKPILLLKGIDKNYARFYCKCFDLQRNIRSKYKIDLTNRQLDNLFLGMANGRKS